jgi:hypothetical protein
MFAVAKQPKHENKPEPKKGDRRTAAVQVDKDLARMAAVVASYDGITQGDLCSPVLRPFLEAEFARVQEAMRRDVERQKNRRE